LRFLITGATGFIGRHLVERLVADGHEVTALVRTPRKAQGFAELGVTLLAGDLSLFADPGLVLDPVDVVVHLAGVVAAQTPGAYEAINYTAVVDLAACLERQVWKPRRLLFASSLAAAGPSPADRAWTEADTPSPVDPYGDAKLRAEQALVGLSFPVTSFRPPVVVGPGDPAWLTLFKAASRGVGFRVAGTPQRLSWVAVDDLVEAIVQMAHDTRDSSHVYFATSEDVIDIVRLWDALQAAFGHRVWVVPVPGPVLEVVAQVAMRAAPILGFHNQLDDKQVAQMRAPSFCCTSASLTADLGWTATIGFEDAVADAAKGYRELGWL
jgi:nucleoside-diphosphate-sugar epimerase